MVNHICPICSKIFTKKSHFLYHVENKKKPCKQIEHNNNLKNPQKSSIEPQKSSQKIVDIIDKCDKNGYYCNFCNYSSIRIDNFKRHMITCKVRKEETQDKEAIFQELIKRMELLENQNNKLFKKNKELNNEINLLKQSSIKGVQNNKNIKNQNNGIINNTIIIQHGKEDLSKIEDKVFFDAFLKYTGSKIPEKIIEGIHFNKKYPEFKNIYISDINREKIMIHNGKNWILTPGENVTSNLLDKSINFSENKYGEINDKETLNERKKIKIESGLKIMELMKEFDSDDQDEEGKTLKKDDKDRRTYLRNKAEEYIKLLLYNNRNEVINEVLLLQQKE